MARETTLTRLLGCEVVGPSGRLGRLADLVVDVADGLERPLVVRLLVRTGRGLVAVPGPALAAYAEQEGVLRTGTEPGRPVPRPAVTELRLRRDVLDAPVMLLRPPRRARVGDVVLDLDAAPGPVVRGVDVTGATAMRRLVPRARRARPSTSVPLSRVHLVSRRGQRAQLRARDAMVHGLEAGEMAEVLTRLPVRHARELLDHTDPARGRAALGLLHPQVSARVTGREPRSRRTRRLHGWRLHRPVSGGREGPSGG